MMTTKTTQDGKGGTMKAKSTILWASGKGEQIDVRRDDDGVYLTIRGSGREPVVVFAPHDDTHPTPHQLLLIAARLGLREEDTPNHNHTTNSNCRIAALHESMVGSARLRS